MKHLLSIFTSFLVLLTLVFTLHSCQDDPLIVSPQQESPLARTYDGNFLQDYFFLNCRITQTTDGFLPTQAARAYGYLGVAAYEAVIHGIDGGKSLAGQINGIEPGSLPTPRKGEEYNWALACNAAAAHTMRRMFEINITKDNRERIDRMEMQNKALLREGVSNEIVERSENYGLAVAEALYQISTTDGGHEAYLDPFSKDKFHMPADEHCWIPTGAQRIPLSPFWHQNRSFIPDIVETSQPGDHIDYSIDENSAFYAQAIDVYEQVTHRNTAEHLTIAKYWADDPFETCTPAGHTFNIGTQLLQESNATLEKTAVGLAMMAVAENDAFISCWKSKYDYVLIRPVSYIQKNIDPNFETVIGTPPFPAYTSGHSAEIGAATKVFIHLFTDESGDYSFTDLSQVQYGFEARTFDNFYEMAEECALSRYYGGIHFEMDNTKGLDLGYAVGDAVVNDLNWPENIQ
ncbi:vanadium-dependent haloperoxidase [Membranicola marinus]|uniref:Vanadium-dependent haloperoxidase n=1 Tax=Membranihabitans marinus TaxID=1227546 RepID=A0A953HWF1_9BACT|nr:vanadium-dependent haloperoxidase [Membranihabitans marinus]MBY5959485.1 vanadium-dependent haloperoxidase [Membranihabitans marinus]